MTAEIFEINESIKTEFVKLEGLEPVQIKLDMIPLNTNEASAHTATAP